MTWHVILFSETRTSSNDLILDGGHRLICHREDYYASGVGILIHKSLTNMVKTVQRVDDRIMAIDVHFVDKEVRFISVYLPHSGLPKSLLEQCYTKMSHLIRSARKNGMAVIIGGDFNTQYDFGDRGMAMQELCSEFELCVCNPSNLIQSPSSWSFESTLGAQRVIDYILITRNIQCIQSDASDLLNMGSDHRSIFCCCKLKVPFEKKTRKKKRKKWKPQLNEKNEASLYHERLDQAIPGAQYTSISAAEKIILESAAAANIYEHGMDTLQKPWENPIVQDLIQQRRLCKEPDQRRILSKRISKLIKQATRKWKTMKGQELLEKFKNFDHLRSLSTKPIANNRTCEVEADDFGRFLANLYYSDRPVLDFDPEQIKMIPLFTMVELLNAVSLMKTNKAGDTQGMIIEMIQHGSSSLHEFILDCFNQILRDAIIPSSWHETIFNMLPKKGDLKDPSNYRPVAILPIMYKLFSKMLYSRLLPVLDRHQTYEQIGFRPKCWIDDAFAIYEGCVGSVIEYNMDIWICSIDLQKAFDRIEFSSIFDALRNHGISEPYVQLLQALYSHQYATVHDSSHFPIFRGVKQGDIISPLLFNCALQIVFENWQRQLDQHGWQLEENGHYLSNIRYADDIMLFAKSADELQEMLTLLVQELELVGLNLHMDKTKILTTSSRTERPPNIQVDGQIIEILNEDEAHRYLGRKINLGSDQRHSFEIDSRISSAWGAFHKYKKTLLNHDISLRLRLKLFNACVTPVALFGLASLPLTRKQLEQFAIVQRKMLRSIVGWKFERADNYEDAMRRMKQRMEQAAKIHFIEPWDRRIAKQQMNFILHLSKLDHRHPARLLIAWDPSTITNAVYPRRPFRSVGRPRNKWYTYIAKFCEDQKGLSIHDWLQSLTDHGFSKIQLYNEYLNYMFHA